jgi:hypothetical protein
MLSHPEHGLREEGAQAPYPTKNGSTSIFLGEKKKER